MSWQKCPICNGSGKIYNTLSSSSYDTCSTCNGKKIISELTGLPPSSNTPSTSNFPTDFRDGPMETQQEYYGKK